MQTLLAKRYAKALLNHAKELKCLDKVAKDLDGISELIVESREFSDFIKNPVIKPENQIEIIDKTLNKKVSKEALNFLKFLCTKNRLLHLQDICTSFAKQYKEDNNILQLQITSKYDLDSKVIYSLSKQLSDKYKKQIEPEVTLDEEMIGGIKIQIDDKVYDNSVKSQLIKFRNMIYQH